MAQTSNPVLSRVAAGTVHVATSGATVTRGGVVTKTVSLLLLLLAACGWAWRSIAPTDDAGPVLLTALLLSIGLGLYTTFRPQHANVTAPMYAVCEGVLLGLISASFEVRYPGLPRTAVLATVGVTLAMLVAYRTGVIQVTDRFKAIVVGLTGGIFVFYLLALAASFFGITVPFLVGGGWVGIGFSLFVVGLASMNLALDFAAIDEAVGEAPKPLEWALAFGLLVTLVWLYLELLRLLSKRK